MSTRILMYHSIGDTVPPGFGTWVVNPARFREQMQSLAQTGYTALTVSGLMALRATHELPRRVVLTFDDGYADFLTQGVPVRREYGMSATLFVCPGLLGRSFHGLPVLDWGMLRQVQAAGFEIGGHSMSHPALDRMSPEKAFAEIRDCKRLLEDRLGAAVTSFAYPFGFLGKATRRAVKRAGYASACAIGYSFSPHDDDALSLRRMIVRQSDRQVDRLPPEAWLYRVRSGAWALTRRVRTEVNGYAS